MGEAQLVAEWHTEPFGHSQPLSDLIQAVKAAAGTAKPLGLEGLNQIGHPPPRIN